MAAGAVALNTSHAGIFISGFGGAIGRVNWIKIKNVSASVLTYSIRRLDAPFTGVPSVRATPGYINAGNPTTGRVFSVTKNDTVAAIGVQLVLINIEGVTKEQIDGPWILNDGALIITCTTVNNVARFECGYEVWPAIRVQPAG